MKLAALALGLSAVLGSGVSHAQISNCQQLASAAQQYGKSPDKNDRDAAEQYRRLYNAKCAGGAGTGGTSTAGALGSIANSINIIGQQRQRAADAASEAAILQESERIRQEREQNAKHEADRASAAKASEDKARQELKNPWRDSGISGLNGGGAPNTGGLAPARPAQ